MARDNFSRSIRFTYSTIDHFSESRTFKTLEGARAYVKRRLGDAYDVSRLGYAVDMHGIGKITLRGGATWTELLGSDPFGDDTPPAPEAPPDDEPPDWASPEWVERERSDEWGRWRK